MNDARTRDSAPCHAARPEVGIPTASDFLPINDYAYLKALSSLPASEVTRLARHVLAGDLEAFCARCDQGIMVRPSRTAGLARLVCLGLEYGAATGNGTCARRLDTLLGKDTPKASS